MNYSDDMNVFPKYTVSEINRYIKKVFDIDPLLHSVTVCGEISNFSRQRGAGHLYFSLKDENSQLKAVMFSREASYLTFSPENGMNVIATGRISSFERDGVYQLYVTSLQPDGAGALALAFEQLKKKLSSEGLFDPSRKKPLPRFPKRIGVITSSTGAAVRDIFSILGRRYPPAQIVFEPVAVQGARAAWELKCAVERFSSLNCADVIIIGRGGGSAEDLWCFNDEMLARAVAACPIPVISAVGHETDFTICDFVADVRAATPSAAAELAVPDISDLAYAAAEMNGRLLRAYENVILSRRAALDRILAGRDFTDPGHFFDAEKHALALLTEKLNNLSRRAVAEKKHSLEMLTGALSSLNPLSVLLRGYGAVEAGGKIVGSVDGIENGDEITVKMSDGQLLCEVKEKWQNK